MSLLTKASTVTTPTAYSEGLLHSVKPVENLGSELVTNGDFSNGTTGWSSGSSTLSVVDGKLKVLATGSFSYARQNITVTSGKRYKITVDFFYNSLIGNIEVYDGTTNTISEQLSEDGVITLYVTPNSTNLRLTLLNRNGVSGDFNYWDNASVKEVIGADFDFARASSATRVNEQGYIEKERENVLLQSNQFDTTWAASVNITATSGQTGYDGTNDAWLLKRSSNASRFIYQNLSAGSSVYTLSFYGKPESEDWVYLYSFNGSGAITAYFDLQNGVVGTTSGSVISTNIEAAGNGYYRCSLTYNTSVSQVRIYPAVGNDSVTGGVSDAGIYIQDAQLEQGLVATDYIETTTSSVAVGITNDIPRINYENGIGNFLLEPQRTNNIPYSEYNPSGINLGANLTFNGYVQSPEGVNNGARFTSITPSASYLQIPNVTIPSGTFTFSMWVRGISGTFINRNMYIPSHTGAQPAMNEAPVAGEDWKLVYGSGTNTSGSSYVRTITLPFYDQPASSVFEVYGFQLEAGSYATSYIPTFGAAVTRAAETCNNAGNSDLFNDSEGVLYAEIAALSDDGTNRQTSISDNSTSDRIMINLHATSNQIQGYIMSGSSEQADMRYTANDATVFNKIAVKYKLNDCALWVNGVEAATDTSAATPVGLSELAFDNGGGSNPFYGKTKMVSTFTEALSDSELECLTSWSSFERMATAQNYNIQ